MLRREFLREVGIGTLAGGVLADFSAYTPGRSEGAFKGRQLKDVNTTRVRDAAMLGLVAIAEAFGEDDAYKAPYFPLRLRPNARFAYSNALSDAQMPGRFLNALAQAGTSFPGSRTERSIDRCERVALMSFSGPLPLPLNRPSPTAVPPVNFNTVNVAHGLHALHSLIILRSSQRAHDLAEACIAEVLDLWAPDRGWDQARVTGAGLNFTLAFPENAFLGGPGMMIEPLTKYHARTASTRALGLLTILKQKALDEYFTPAGRYDPARMGTHIHNVLFVLAGLARLAYQTRDPSLMARVAAFYRNSADDLHNQIFWTPAFTGPNPARRNAGPDLGKNDSGEVGNCALLLQTALFLALGGQQACYGDIEVALRSHILPSQVRDTSVVDEVPNSTTDVARDVRMRARGQWTNAAPYGHQPSGVSSVNVGIDNVGTITAILIEILRHQSRYQDGKHYVDLLFDHSTDDLSVESPYTHEALKVILKKPGDLFVRVPEWLPVNNLKVVGGAPSSELIDGYMHVTSIENGAVRITMPLPERATILRWSERGIAATLRGDEVARMENFGMDWTFFPAA